jgi:dTDP-glucose 4,6-dehydratase
MIIVTGASGFIGYSLVEELVKRGYRVLGISRRGKVPEGAEALSWDLRKPLDITGNIEAIFHLAASAVVRRSYIEEWQFIENNILMTLNMARLALSKRALLILASSADIYPQIHTPRHSYAEDFNVLLAPASMYAVSKIASEAVVRHYSVKGLRAAILRPTSTYGRLLFDQSENAREYFVEKTLYSMLSQVPELTFDGFPESSRQWLYYPDHVSAYLTVFERCEPQPVETFNVAHKESYSLAQIVELLSKLTEWNGIVKWGIKPRPIDPNFQILNTSKIERLGWSPRFDLNSGLSDYVDRLRKIMQKSFS